MATQAVEVSTKRPSLRERLDLGSGFTPYFLVLPTVIVILAVAAYPILNSIWLSFLDSPLSPSAKFIGLSNFVQIFRGSDFRISITRTSFFSFVIFALEQFLVLVIALPINATF